MSLRFFPIISIHSYLLAPEVKLSISQKPCRILLSWTELSPIAPPAGVETRNISCKFSLTPASCQVPPRSMPTTSKGLQDPWCVCCRGRGGAVGKSMLLRVLACAPSYGTEVTEWKLHRRNIAERPIWSNG